jgi:hypothetical protein
VKEIRGGKREEGKQIEEKGSRSRGREERKRKRKKKKRHLNDQVEKGSYFRNFGNLGFITENRIA